MAAELHPALEAVPRCPLCGGEESKPFCQHTEDRYLSVMRPELKEHAVQWVTCTACDLVYQNPRPSERALGDFYRQGYRSGPPSEESLKGKLRDASIVVNWINDGWRPAKGSGWSLDVGCGEGALVKTLGAFHKAGGPKWKARGVEPTEVYAKFARERLTVEVSCEPFSAKSCPGVEFELITAQHVLEHIHDFPGFLALCKKKLRPQGRLYIGTPAIELPWGENWARPTPPHHETFAVTHLQIFSSRTLARALNQAGFFVERLDHYIRGTLCLSRHARPDERNELAGRDDLEQIAANFERAHQLWVQYQSDPKRRHPFVQQEAGGAPGSAAAGTQILDVPPAVAPGGPEPPSAPVAELAPASAGQAVAVALGA